jgi:hypothetical protein
MPDTRKPDNTINDDLDARIRQLVARAVADAPPPPDLTRGEATIEPTEPDHRRWWIGGGAAVAAAAAMIISLAVITTGDETTEPTPLTQPPSVTTVPVQPTAPPSTAPAPPEASAGAILTAGPDGVVEHLPNGEQRTLTDEPMAIALAGGVDAVITQRVAGWTGEDGNWERTVPQILSADGSLTDLGGTADWDGAVTIHDVEMVGDSRLMLYDLQSESPDTGATAVLYAFDLFTFQRVEIARDAGTIISKSDRLHLTTDGLIVGSSSTSITTSIEMYAIPGSPAEGRLPTLDDLGLPEPFDECIDCPRSFAVTPDGSTFAWLEGETTLHIRTLDGNYDESFELPESTPNSIGASLDIGGGQVLLTPEPLNADSPPLAIDLADPTAEPTTLTGTWATLGPAATLGEPTLPQQTTPTSAPGPAPATTSPPGATTPPTEPPTTTTTAPASGVIDDVVTAGPGGVVAYQDGEPNTITTEPMEMALATGDGRYVTQTRFGRGTVRPNTAIETMPYILSADGETNPLWGSGDPAWIELHDVEVVDGRRLLVYTADPDIPVEDPLTEDEFATTVFVADLDNPAAEPVELGQFSSFEGGVSRLHLATTGLVVGEAFESATHRLGVFAVPGSPAASSLLPTPADLDLEDSYSDCTDCPRRFTVSPHGTVFAWLHRSPGVNGQTQLVVHPIDGSPEQRFDPFPDDLNTTFIDDLDYLAEGAQLLSYVGPGVEEPRAPVHIATDGTVTELAGTVATGDPTGS